MASDDLMNGVRTGRTIWHQTQQASGQRIDLALFEGQVVHASGETATYAGVETILMHDDGETFSGQLIVLLADGSISNQSFEGVSTSRQGSKVGGTGTWKMTSGSGRYAELRGGGTFTWAVDGDAYREEFSG